MNDRIEDLGLEPYVGSEIAMKVYDCKSYSTLWMAIKDGTFPAPDKVIKRVRKWKPSTLRKWQNYDKA
jgi:predicted Rdx family selenoprotein